MLKLYEVRSMRSGNATVEALFPVNGIRRVMEIIGRDYISPENRTPVVHVPMEYGPVLSAGGKYVQ